MIALTFGNPNGIGPEVAAKAVEKIPPRLLQDFILIGDEDSYNHYFKKKRNINFLPVDVKFPYKGCRFCPGEQSPVSGALSWLFLQKAVELAKKGDAAAIVTAPISKELIVRSGQKGFIDHTTFFANEFKVKKFNMMFYSEDLKVILATIHIPLKRVAVCLTRELVKNTLNNALQFGRKLENKNYRVAVCGLNPHAGENGLMGNEDREIILPAVRSFQKKGYAVAGPLPADTVFYKAYQGEYDIVVAMYHDQGLAPFKLLHFENGVNVTLGLPIVRTSPDHGTAFDIAGKGKASSGSMLSAIKLALRLTGRE